MNANKQAKVEVVKEIVNKINKAEGIVVAKYDGLTVSEFQLLRSQLSEKDVELKVYKNRLFKIAAKDAGIEEIQSSLTGQNVFAFGMSDDISPAKVLAAFAKDHEALELKAGTYEGRVIGADEVKEVATLPSLEEALTMLATQLISPVKYVGVGLNQLVEENHLVVGEEVKTSDNPTEETKAETPTEEVVAKESKEEAPVEKTKAEESNEEEPSTKVEMKEGE